MKKLLFLFTLLLGISVQANAQVFSNRMEEAIKACIELQKAMSSGSTTALREANKELKAADIFDFGDLRLTKGKDISVDGHLIFDEVFIDSLIAKGPNGVKVFASRFARNRSITRSSTGVKGRIKMTTKALGAGKTAVWKTINRKNAEYAIVAEPGGLFTMTIRDENGKVLFAETSDNKIGKDVRMAKIILPDRATRIYIEVKNNGKIDASFALLGN